MLHAAGEVKECLPFCWLRRHKWCHSLTASQPQSTTSRVALLRYIWFQLYRGFYNRYVSALRNSCACLVQALDYKMEYLGSNPDEVDKFWNWFNPSSGVIALWSTQPLTEI
jgi:hypothetical protein